jgi:hypothetical protein
MDVEPTGEHTIPEDTIEVVETPDGVRYTVGSQNGLLYHDSKLNHTPLQCGSLMKLLRGSQGRIAFRNPEGRLVATIALSDDHSAAIAYYAGDGTPAWTDTLQAEECLPDAPRYLIPRIRPMYRALTGAFMLFLLVLFPIMFLYPTAGPAFATAASIGIVLVVAACVGVLVLIRTWLKL